MKSFFIATVATLCCGKLTMAASTPVFAHFMVQNSYNYFDASVWSSEMKVAQAAGIDGFILNWIPPDCTLGQYNLEWQADRIADAFDAAEPLGFKLAYSFDMSYTSSTCSNGIAWNVTYMADQIYKYVGHYAFFSWNGVPVVTTYDGQVYGDAFFNDLKNAVQSRGSSIWLTPALTNYAYASTGSTSDSSISNNVQNLLNAYPSIDGFVNWQAWPYDSHDNLTASADSIYQSAFANAGRQGPYIMAVSPWQFKDLDDGSTADSWVQYSDVLYPQRWNAAITQVKPAIIEILTWNDFPESHYISDLPPIDQSAPKYAQLNQYGNYIYNQPHAAWRNMTRYYTTWLKSGNAGAPPAPDSDIVVFWYRRHPKNVACSNGAPSIRNSDFPADELFWWSAVQSDSVVTVQWGSEAPVMTSVSAGSPSLGSVAFPTDLGGDGIVPTVKLMRNGQVVASADGTLPVSTSCDWQDYNPIVGIATTG